MNTPRQAGDRWTSELKVSEDPVSGATVRQLTTYKAHSSHNYFTYSGWYEEGRKVVIISDRENRTNLFGVDLDGGEMTQLTDFGPGGGIGSFCVNPTRDEIYFTHAGVLTALDLTSLRTRELFIYPEGYNPGGVRLPPA